MLADRESTGAAYCAPGRISGWDVAYCDGWWPGVAGAGGTEGEVAAAAAAVAAAAAAAAAVAWSTAGLSDCVSVKG
jgi:hypothetical protein